MIRYLSFIIDAPIAANVRTGLLDNRDYYFSLGLNDGNVSFILPGENAGAIATAREIAQVLTDAADALETTLRSKNRASTGDEAAEQDVADSCD